MHEIETLARLLEDELPQGISFRFHSFGAGYQKLKQRVGFSNDLIPNVQFQGALDHKEWIRAMESYPIALITLRKGAERVSFPSKTFSALMAGQAILAICSKDSDLANLVIDSNCGWVVEPGDVHRLRNLLASLPSSLEQITRMRRNAYALGHQHFSMQSVQLQWTELFKRLATRQPKLPAPI